MEGVQCDLCHRKFDDETLLSIHHEYEQCYCTNNVTLTEGEFHCPLCDRICYDPLVLQIHINEDHDQSTVHTPSSELTTQATTSADSLYAQVLERRERMKHQYEQQSNSTHSTAQSREINDAQIAHMLQEEENSLSFKEFQHRYGGSTKTYAERARLNLDNIYKKKFISKEKYEEYKTKLDDIIAQPIERNESRSSGIIQLLSQLPMIRLADRRLCRPGCDHISATWLDQGWACGYKNFQMLLSSLRHDPQYAMHLFGCDAMNQSNRDIPSVSHLQKLIEKSWAAGFDSEGRQQFNNQLVNSTKWIGPTEIMAGLSYLNIKTELFEFCKPRNLEKSIAYKYLFEWVQRYFKQKQQENTNNNIHPLYLQQEGHSRTIVGYEENYGGHISLLVFDPSISKFNVDKFSKTPSQNVHLFRRTLQSFQKPVYQILNVCGLIQPNEKEAFKKIRSTKVPIPNN